MDWKTYEEVVKKIYEALGKDAGVQIVCSGSSCSVTGKSTVKHQIDVLTKHSDGLHEYKTAIECKYWNDTINKDIVMKVHEIVSDANLNKGIIVSKLGFTPDAITFAKHCNVGLVELREISEDDFNDRIRKVVINLELFRPDISRMDFIADIERQDMLATRGLISSFTVLAPDGKTYNVARLAEEFIRILTNRKEEGKEIIHVFRFPEGSVATGQALNVQITGVQFTGKLEILRKTVEINGRDHIWLIMKSVFENKEFIISKQGVIEELK
jgi:hypothetical protein